MSCCLNIYNVEPREDHLPKNTEDYETAHESYIIDENRELLKEILETFHRDKGFSIKELL